jgi:hypothetical protein
MAKSTKKKKEESVEIQPTAETLAAFDKEPIAQATIEVSNERIFLPEEYPKDEPPPNVGMMSALPNTPIYVAYRKELDANLPFEERIEAFIDSRNEGMIRMNDFLKSLYGVPQFNTPPKWASPQEMKSLGGILENMQNAGKINIQNDTHKQLGKHYYSGDDQRLSHHNLNTVTIEVKK